jgi:hypothetical protein
MDLMAAFSVIGAGLALRLPGARGGPVSGVVADRPRGLGLGRRRPLTQPINAQCEARQIDEKMFQIDEKMFLETCAPPPEAKAAARRAWA